MAWRRRARTKQRRVRNAAHENITHGRARRVATITIVLLLASVAIAGAHDLFLQPIRYFVDPNSEVHVRVLNGTFSRSENSIVRGRLRDSSFVSPAGRQRLDTSVWTAEGDTSTFSRSHR